MRAPIPDFPDFLQSVFEENSLLEGATKLVYIDGKGCEYTYEKGGKYKLSNTSVDQPANIAIYFHTAAAAQSFQQTIDPTGNGERFILLRQPGIQRIVSTDSPEELVQRLQGQPSVEKGPASPNERTADVSSQPKPEEKRVAPVSTSLSSMVEWVRFLLRNIDQPVSGVRAAESGNIVITCRTVEQRQHWEEIYNRRRKKPSLELRVDHFSFIVTPEIRQVFFEILQQLFSEKILAFLTLHVETPVTVGYQVTTGLLISFQEAVACRAFETVLTDNGLSQAAIQRRQGRNSIFIADPASIEKVNQILTQLLEEERLIKTLLPAAAGAKIIADGQQTKIEFPDEQSAQTFPRLELAAYAQGKSRIFSTAVRKERILIKLRLESISAQVRAITSAASVTLDREGQYIDVVFSNESALASFQQDIQHNSSLQAIKVETVGTTIIRIPQNNCAAYERGLVQHQDERAIRQTLMQLLTSSEPVIKRGDEGEMLIELGHRHLVQLQRMVSRHDPFLQEKLKFAQAIASPQVAVSFETLHLLDDDSDNDAPPLTQESKEEPQSLSGRVQVKIPPGDVRCFESKLKAFAGKVSEVRALSPQPIQATDAIKDTSRKGDAELETSQLGDSRLSAFNSGHPEAADDLTVRSSPTPSEYHEPASVSLDRRSCSGSHSGGNPPAPTQDEKVIRSKLRSVSYDSKNDQIILHFEGLTEAESSYLVGAEQGLFRNSKKTEANGEQQVSFSVVNTFLSSEKGQKKLATYIKERAESKWFWFGKEKQHYLPRSFLSLFSCRRSDATADGEPDPYSRESKLRAAGEALIYFCAQQNMSAELSTAFTGSVLKSLTQSRWVSNLGAAVHTCRTNPMVS